jgi:arylsulfatase A-like enzyme
VLLGTALLFASGACGGAKVAAVAATSASGDVKSGESKPGDGHDVGSGDAGAARAAVPRPVYDFISNRVHGLEYLGQRLIIRAGGPEFQKFVDGGWKTAWVLGQKDEGRDVALVGGLSSTVFVPLDQDGDGVGAAGPGAAGTAAAAGDRQLNVSLRSLVPGQRLSVFVNEIPAGTVDVPAAFGDVSVNVPAKAWKPGENRVRLTFRGAALLRGGGRSAAAVARLTVGPPVATVVVPPASALAPSDQTLGGVKHRAFTLSGPGRLSFFVQVPRNAKLQLAHAGAAAGTSIVARVARDGVATRTLFEGATGTSFSDASWDLSAEAGQAVRIDLVGRGGGTIWGEPRIIVAAPVPEALPEKAFDHIFVWMVDTLRADKVHVFNPKTRVETPNYDAFAADATRFAWAQVPGTWSLPSHSSILTGVYPSVHEATAHKARLSPKVAFIAELMKKGGYHTGLFSSNGYVSSKWGFDRGWDESRNFIREDLPNGAEYLWKTARGWVDLPNNRSKPKFLYLATVEPHVIYNPKKEFLAHYWKKPYDGPIRPAKSGVQLGLIKAGKLKVDATDKAYLESLHDAEITQSDAAFAGFIKDLKSRKIYDSSVVVVISDHGDEFWEHGDVGHAQGVYQELVHIPLIIRAPGVLPAGRVVDADVEAMDLFPTLLDLAGLPIPAATQGTSLLPVVQDELAQSPRVSLTQNLGITRGIKLGRYRLVHGGANKLEIYDELADPREQTDLADNHPIAMRQLRNVFGLLYANENVWRKRAWGTAANLNEAFYQAQ